jgi:hypothetical protein
MAALGPTPHAEAYNNLQTYYAAGLPCSCSFTIPFGSRTVVELLCLMFAGCDGGTADAEHRRQLRQRIGRTSSPSRPVPLIYHVGHVQGLGKLVVVIWGVLGMTNLHLSHCT